MADAQQGADFHVLPGLGHDAFVGGDDHDHDIDPGGAGHHVLDEFFMTGDVHHPDVLPVRQVEGGKAQLDGDSALFLLFQAVGVGAGHRLDQGGLAVIDVSGRTEDDLFQWFSSRVRKTLREVFCIMNYTAPSCPYIFNCRFRAGVR